MIYISNAFSLQMPPDGLQRLKQYNKGLPGSHGAANQLGFAIKHDRKSINLMDGDVLYVAQLTGGRLPEGASELPEGFHLEWREVTVYAYDI